MKKNEYRNEFEVAFCRSKFLMIILGLIQLIFTCKKGLSYYTAKA